jgi:hypothetical protein
METMTALTTKMRKAVHPSHAQLLSLSVLISSSAFKRPTNVMAFQTAMMGVMNRAVVSSSDSICFVKKGIKITFVNHCCFLSLKN